MSTLSVTERRNRIIEILNANGKVSVNELKDYFGVSSVIIRADLSELEKQGMLSRVHGGAITSYKLYYDMSLVQRSNANAQEKKIIAQKVSEMIHDFDTIIMNAGTTPLFIMRELESKKVTIVTNSIALALEGAKNPNFKIVLLGGDVDSEYQFTYGISAIKALEQYTADILIMSVDGVDPIHGISTFYHQEAEVCKKMMEHAHKIIVAADYSKIGRTAFAKIDEIDKIDMVVTAGNVDMSCINRIKSKNIEVVAVKEK